MKTMIYWVGLILVGLGIWGIFAAFWIYMLIMGMRFAFIARFSLPIFLVVGVIIFLPIGLRMMKEAK